MDNNTQNSGQMLPPLGDDDQDLPIVNDNDQKNLTSTPIDQQAMGTMENDITQEADDIDVIEKAWIDRAKHIVDQTSSDPYEQQKMISKMKAEYIKKRFNKDIKISEE